MKYIVEYNLCTDTGNRYCFSENNFVISIINKYISLNIVFKIYFKVL